MVRKGWTRIEVPEGWTQLIRGPRPPSVQWPRAVLHSQKQGTRNLSAASSRDSVPAMKSKVVKDTKVARLEVALSALGDQESTAKAALQEALRKARMEAKVVRHHQERAAEAADRVSRLQSALDLLGHDSPDAEHLKVSLKKVQEQSRVRLLGERLDSCLQFIERAKGRVSRAEARILEAQDDKRLAESQLAQVQQDLARMREEASVSDDPPPEHVPRCDPNEEVQRLRVQVAKLEAEIAAQATTRVVSSFSQPHSHGWRVRTSFRAEITALRGGQTVTHPTDVQTVSGCMAALIDAGDAKRKCVDNTPL